MAKRKCNGVRTSGYWRGYPCGAEPVAMFDGKWYCASHCTTAMHSPHKFAEARKSQIRKQERRSNKAAGEQ